MANFDKTNSTASGLNPTTITTPHTMSTAPDGIILAHLCWFDSSGQGDPSSIKYAGVSLTKSISDSDGNYKSQWWYLVNPATGTNNMVATWGSAINDYAILTTYSATDAKQSSQPDSTGHNEDPSNTTITATITTILDRCLAVDGFMNIDNKNVITAGTNQIQRIKTDSVNFSSAVSDLFLLNAGVSSMTETQGGAPGRLLELIFAIAPQTIQTVTPMKIKLLMIGGGGGGGTAISSQDGGGGGGGGGEYYYDPVHYVTSGGYVITVGAGGAGGLGTNQQGVDGGTTAFDVINVNGGGGGGGKTGGINGRNKSSGGGGSGGLNGGVAGVGGGTTVLIGQGNIGGNGGVSRGGGGGGGSGGVGATATSDTGANGGLGKANSISGASVSYGGGGGAGGSTGGTGNGGGGNGGTGSNGSAGTANTGGGGGGDLGGVAGTGGSGVVIISYATDGSDGISSLSTGGTKTTSGGQTIHTFTASGTFGAAKPVTGSPMII